ncbi:MAG: hypothetical protein H7Z72_25745 [Bacteroidetes bacterium]|nr:hypothetical protein [Fibrella sp.]
MLTVTNRCPNRVARSASKLLSSLLVLVALQATAQVTWTTRQQGFNLNAITYAGSQFVGVGTDNTVALSTDGTTWSKALVGTSDQLYGIAVDGSFVVAVGRNGRIMRSINEGFSWSIQSSGTANELRDVAYGGSVFVAVGEGGTILTSPNGSTWTPRSSGTTNDLLGVGYGDGQFTAVGTFGTLLTSTNGTTWIARTSGTIEDLRDVAYGSGKYVVVGGFTNNNVTLTSTNGVTWTGQSFTGSADQPLNGITFGGGQFVSVGTNGLILTSPDGTTWANRTLTLVTDLQDVVYAGGRFVTVGRVIRTSTDAITWQLTNAPDNTSRLTGVAYGNGRTVVVGNLYQGVTRGTVLTSTNGFAFTRTDHGNFGIIGGIVFAQGLFVAVGDNITTSPDGLTWTLRSSNAATGQLGKITYGNGRFVAVGGSGRAAVSTDGINWTATSMGTTTQDFLDVTYGNGLFVAVGPAGSVRTSPDGSTWTERTVFSQNNSFLSSVAYGNGTFVAVGYQGGSIRRSVDGINWTGTVNSSGADFGRITFDNGLFVIVNGSGNIRTTPDGLDPVPRQSNFTGELLAVGFGDGQFLAVGADATILTSPAIPTFTNLPPVAPVIPNQTATVGVNFFQNTPSFTDPNSSVQIISVQAFNLPPGLSYSGGASGIVAGSPTTAGVYSVSLVATDNPNESITGGLSATAVYTITVNPAGPPVGTFNISAVTLLDCIVFIPGGPNKPEQRALYFAPAYTGTFTPPMSFSVVSLLPLTTDADARIYPSVDAPTVTIFARDAVGRTATYVWNWLAQCGITPSASFAISNVAISNCAVLSPASASGPAQWQITYTPQLTGTYTLPVTQSVVAAMLPTTSMGPFTLTVGADAPTLTLVARDAENRSAPDFTWNWLQACANNSVNTPPTVVTPLPDRLAGQNLPFNLTLPASTFTDAETPDNLTYAITGLPEGLTSSGLVISGSPTGTTGVPLTITVTATDPGGLSVSTTFKLSVSFIAPPSSFAIASVSVGTCTVLSPASASGPAQWQITYTPQLTGTYTLPVTQSVVAAMLPTTSTGPFTLNVSADSPQLTLVARDAANRNAPDFTWNWLQACTSGARLGVGGESQLRVVVLGNPTRGEAVEVEISGVAGVPVELEMTNAQGIRVDQHRIRRAGATERYWVKTGRSAGLYLLRVRSASQLQTVKVLKQ